MEEIVPRPLRIAAVLQLTSGLLDVVLVSWTTWLGISCVCGLVTLPLLTAGSACGLVGFLLIPVGLLEIGAGFWGLQDPRQGVAAMRYVSVLQILALCFGGLSTAVTGVVVRRLLASDDVLIWLEG